MLGRAYVYGWIAILAILAGFELFALFHRDRETPTLTRTVITYVPWWVTLPFLSWLLLHFLLRYWRE